MARHQNKRIKIDEDDEEDWGDEGFEFTANDFDIVQSQAISQFIAPKTPPPLTSKPSNNDDIESLKKQIKELQDSQDAKQGEISILRSKYEHKCEELTKEKIEREKLIEQRLKDEVERNRSLKTKTEKLETALEFKNQELMTLQTKHGNKSKESQNIDTETPKKLKVSPTKAALPRFPNNESFYQRVNTSKGNKATQTSQVASFKRDSNIKTQLPTINNILRPMIIRETKENSPLKLKELVPIQFDLPVIKDVTLKLDSKIIYNLPETNVKKKTSLNSCYLLPLHETYYNTTPHESDLIKNTVTVLQEYLDFIGKASEKQCLSSECIFTGDRKSTPELLQIKLIKWNSQDELKFDKLHSSVKWILKYFYSYLNNSPILREMVVKELSTDYQQYPLLLRGSPNPSAHSSNETPNNSPRNEGKYTIGSVLYACATPIKIGDDLALANQAIVKNILQIFCLLIKYCDQCCVNEYSTMLKSSILRCYIQNTFPSDLRALGLEIMLQGACSSTLRDIFINKHKDKEDCLLHALSNFQHDSNEIITMKTKLIVSIIGHHGIETVLNFDCACLRAYMNSFLTWLQKEILEKEIKGDNLLGYLSFLNIITSIKEPSMRSVEQKMQNFVQIIHHLSCSRVDLKEIKINALLIKLTGNFPKYGPID